jgi:hypothetical protein
MAEEPQRLDDEITEADEQREEPGVEQEPEVEGHFRSPAGPAEKQYGPEKVQ